MNQPQETPEACAWRGQIRARLTKIPSIRGGQAVKLIQRNQRTGEPTGVEIEGVIVGEGEDIVSGGSFHVLYGDQTLRKAHIHTNCILEMNSGAVWIKSTKNIYEIQSGASTNTAVEGGIGETRDDVDGATSE